MKYYEVFFDNCHDTAICIKANREPTLVEATIFCMKDIKAMGFTQVTEISELTKEEAYHFYDMSNEENFPIFGEEV